MIERVAWRTGGFLGTTVERTLRSVVELLPGAKPAPRRSLVLRALPTVAGTALGLAAGAVTVSGRISGAVPRPGRSDRRTGGGSGPSPNGGAGASRPSSSSTSRNGSSGASRPGGSSSARNGSSGASRSGSSSSARNGSSSASRSGGSGSSRGSAGTSRRGSSGGGRSRRATSHNGTASRNGAARRAAGGAKNLAEKSRAELYELARKAGIEGRSAMSKKDLTRALSR